MCMCSVCRWYVCMCACFHCVCVLACMHMPTVLEENIEYSALFSTLLYEGNISH